MINSQGNKMTAKKHLIQTMRKEIKNLNGIIKGQREHLTGLERKLEREKLNNFLMLERTAQIVNYLLPLFQKELAWVELSNDSNNQLHSLKSITHQVRSEVDRYNETFMEKNLDIQSVEMYYKRKLERGVK